MSLTLITSHIVNLKTVRDVLGLGKCYQCGGETLVPVVKYPVRAASSYKSLIRFRIQLYHFS